MSRTDEKVATSCLGSEPQLPRCQGEAHPSLLLGKAGCIRAGASGPPFRALVSTKDAKVTLRTTHPQWWLKPWAQVGSA